MTALVVLAAVGVYLVIGARLAESCGRRSYRRARVWRHNGRKDIDGTVCLIVLCFVVWPLAWPLVNVWERIVAPVVDRDSHEVLR